MDIILFMVSIGLVSISVYCQEKLLKLADFWDKVVTWFVLFPANIVLVTYILSELYWISLTGYLVFQAIFASVSVVIYLKIGKRKSIGPGPKETAIENEAQGHFSQKSIRIVGWIIKGLFAVIALAALLRLFIGIYMPVTISDAITCHMSRVGYWLQNGTLHHYYTPTEVQNFQAPNTQILILWTVAFLKNDILANIIQWFAYCGIGFSLYQTGRNLGFSKQIALFSSLIYLSLPMVVLQSITTFYDLGVTFFTITFFYFFHSALKNKNKSRLLLSAISFGLAVGSKGTVFYMFPALFIACLILLRIYKPQRAFLKIIIAFFISGFFLFGSYNYIQNFVDYGNPFASKVDIKGVHSEEVNMERILSVMVMHGFESIDFRGLPDFLVNQLNNYKKSIYKKYLINPIFQKYSRVSGYPLKYWDGYNNIESRGWFGFLGTILYFPVLFFILSKIVFSHKRDFIEKWLYAFIAFTFFICFIYYQIYSPWQSRYFVLPFVFIAPLLASIFCIKNKPVRILIFILTALIAAKTTVQCSLYSRHKLLSGEVNIFNASKLQIRALFAIPPFARFISEIPPKTSTIGHVSEKNDPDYLFFDKNFKRTIIPIKRKELEIGALNVMKKYNLDFLVLNVKAGEADRTFNPVYSARRYIDRTKKRSLIVIPKNDNWDEIIKKCTVFDKNRTDYNFPQLIKIFDGAQNLNTPLRILFETASYSEDIKEIKIAEKSYPFPLEKPLIKQINTDCSYNVLAFAPGHSMIIIQGRTIGYCPELELYNEKSELVLKIPVDKNGIFNYELLPTKLYPIDGRWKLFQIGFEKPGKKAKISELKVKIKRNDYNK